jgi:hypothetical protein
MMNELLEKLQESPPQSEEELEQLLGETGYDLVPTEPTAPEGDDMGDMSAKDEDEEMEMKEEDEELPPPPMKMPGKGAPTRVELSIKRYNAAKNALDGEGKGKKKNMKGGMYG